MIWTTEKEQRLSHISLNSIVYKAQLHIKKPSVKEIGSPFCSLPWLKSGALILRPFYWIAIGFASPPTLIQTIRAFKAFINNLPLLPLAPRSQP